MTNAPDFIPPGYYYYRSHCAPNSQDHSFGSSISSSWFTYRNPKTNDLVEGAHLPWEEGYTGDYFTVRVAAAEGGAVDGHTSRVIKSGQGLELNFIAEPGYELISVSGTCDSIWRAIRLRFLSLILTAGLSPHLKRKQPPRIP